MLESRVNTRVGTFRLDVALTVDRDETIAVLGPNGAGKTTLLNALAGLVPLVEGRIVLDGSVLDEPSTRTWVPPEHRPIGVVFQQYLLFPHLSAIDNIAFGLRSRGVRRGEARRRARAWLARMGLSDRAGARPAELSGGEAQRVALARALATEPVLLLLDEPLAALDIGTRAGIRRDLRAQLSSFGGVKVVVSHDPVEAMSLADRLVVIEAGRIVQMGNASEIVARPRSPYVAELAGTNLFRGRGRGDRVELPGGAELAVADAGDGDVLAVVHPHGVALHRRPPEGSPRNVWSGRAVSIERAGDRVRVQVTGALSIVAEITAAALTELELIEGSEVWVSVKATEVAVFPA
jgi:molybdate transport system ATP-binding protein